jgi:hypothetical protein
MPVVPRYADVRNGLTFLISTISNPFRLPVLVLGQSQSRAMRDAFESLPLPV